jgi:hypothetical protein
MGSLSAPGTRIARALLSVVGTRSTCFRIYIFVVVVDDDDGDACETRLYDDEAKNKAQNCVCVSPSRNSRRARVDDDDDDDDETCETCETCETLSLSMRYNHDLSPLSALLAEK